MSCDVRSCLVRTGFSMSLLGAVASSGVRAEPFYTGGDVSLLPFIESRGGTFRSGGMVRPADQIMVEKGSNLFRLRLFVNPNTSYSATNGAIQNLSSTIVLASRLKASGAKILLDFHYSDTWADPGQQAKPSAWTALSFNDLKTTLRNYTRDSLLAFRDAGVMPEFVQVGNEVTNGMLWPSGQVLYTGSTAVQNGSWRNFGDLLNAAIAGVREVDATVPGQRTMVAIHIDGGSVDDRAAYFYGKLTNTALVSPSSYDILGLSFYPSAAGHLANLQENLSYIASSTPLKTMVLEANHPWKGTANGSQWASTQSGQRDYWIAVRDAVRNLPNDKGLGALWWYPEAIQVPGTNIWQGGRIALFDDSGGDALPALDHFSPGGTSWAVDADGDWTTASSWTSGVPSAQSAIARFGPNATADRTVSIDGDVTVGAVTLLSDRSYTLTGSGRLLLDVGTGPARIESVRGAHTIGVPVVSADDVELSAAWSHSLTFAQSMTAANQRVTKVGSGRVSIDRLESGSLDVQFGTLQLTGSTPSQVTALSVGQQASLQIANGLIVDVAAEDLDVMANQIRVLLGGMRITPLSSSRAVGYAVAGAIDSDAFLGVEVDASAILLRATTRGDADLSGTVDFDDLLRLAQHYGNAGMHWWQGDFDYNGVVAFEDLLSLAQNYGTSLAVDAIGLSGCNAAFAADLHLAMALVPEPALVACVPAWMMLGRRRRDPLR